MLVPYYPEESRDHYYKYYTNQLGGFGVFQGATIQRGGGIGSLLKGLAKSTLPLLKAGGKVVGKQLLSAGLGIAEDLVRGKSFREAATDNFKESGKGLINAISSKVYDRKRKAPPRRRQRGPPQKRRRARPRSSLLRNVKVGA